MSSPSFKVLQQRPQGVVAVLEVDFLVLGCALNPSLRAHVNPSIKDSLYSALMNLLLGVSK